jgi:hypothetical protein
VKAAALPASTLMMLPVDLADPFTYDASNVHDFAKIF